MRNWSRLLAHAYLVLIPVANRLRFLVWSILQVFRRVRIVRTMYALYGIAILKPLPTINICYVEHPRSRRAYYNPNDTLSVEVEQVN